MGITSYHHFGNDRLACSKKLWEIATNETKPSDVSYTTSVQFDKEASEKPNTDTKLAVSSEASWLATPLRSPQRD